MKFERFRSDTLQLGASRLTSRPALSAASRDVLRPGQIACREGVAREGDRPTLAYYCFIQRVTRRKVGNGPCCLRQLVTVASKISKQDRPFGHVCVNGMVASKEIPGIEVRLTYELHVVVPNGVGKYRQQVFGTSPRNPHAFLVVE